MRILLSVAVATALGACSSSDNGNCGDGGCLDASFFFDGPTSTPDAGPSYVPANGDYVVTDFTAGTKDECMINPGALKGDATAKLAVTVVGDTLKIGNPKGTPPLASLGEGSITGPTFNIARMNHVAVDAPSTCEYDSDVLTTVSLDDPTKKTIGVSVSEKQLNRRTCDKPAGVGMSCTSTWSWRLSPAP